jgi:hypothetical protein
MSYAAKRIDERRRALAALTRIVSRHDKACKWDLADAMTAAKIDTLRALKEDAAYLIEESVSMPLRDWAPASRAAA